MSNEDMALMIQQGHTEYYSELWENVRGFVAYLAVSRMNHVQDRAAVETEDLIQAGFLGLVEAVRTFEPEEGAFLSWLKFHLKRAFNNACGVGSARPANDPIHTAVSLDAPIDADDPEGPARGDIIRDPVDMADMVDGKVYQEQLRVQLERLLSRLSPKAADMIRATYLDAEPIEQVAARYGITVKNLSSSRNGYLHQLRVAARSTPDGAALRRFLEDNTNYYLHIGPESFHSTHTSAPEYLTMRREDLKKQYQHGVG